MPYVSVICPAAPWENDTLPHDQAYDQAHDLAIEYGYAQIRQDGRIVFEFHGS